MVDFFLLVLIGGAGDELQGIKRGIMEMADGIIVNKADGDNVQRANRAMAEVKNAVHLFPLAESGQPVNVMTCSALTHHNVPEVWKMVTDHVDNIRKSGYLAKKRAKQDVQTMYDSIEQTLKDTFYENSLIKDMIALMESDVKEKRTTAYTAAHNLLETYFKTISR
jgi:LAO/AO transport system kinase